MWDLVLNFFVLKMLYELRLFHWNKNTCFLKTKQIFRSEGIAGLPVDLNS